ncbi:MAG: hypothetical protein Fur0010_16730 [Bdellovibrio sp.]
MKRVFFLAIIWTSALWAQAPSDIVQSQHSLDFNLNLQNIELAKYKGAIPLSKNFSEIKYDNWPVNNLAGMPRVPFQSFIFEGEADQVKVVLETGEAVKIDETPTPEFVYPCRCDNGQKAIEFKFNQKSFDEGSSLYKVEKLGDFRGRPLLRLSVFPFQTENQKLVVYPQLKVRFDGAQKLRYSMSDKKLLIVGPQSLLNSIDELKKVRESQGFEVKVMAIDSIAKDAVKLKNFFHQTQSQWAYTHAIILGDETVVFMDKMKTSSSDETPSDLPFFLMGGAEDTVPDVFFGRFPAQNARDIELQVQRILNFEDQMKNGQLPRKALGIASDEGANPSDVEYMESMLNPFINNNWDATRVYQGNQNHSNKNIADAINSGVSWINYIGHGSGYSWISVRDKEYTSNQVKALKNNNKWPIIVDVACQNGRMSGDGRLGENFLKARDQKNNPTGAVAFYGGTVDISWHPPAVMAVGINQILEKSGPKELGALLFEGQLHLIKNWRTASEATENWRWYNLMGDPSMRVELF